VSGVKDGRFAFEEILDAAVPDVPASP
jgi:hypothetical protein